ncbi:MAG: hypothetical protein K2L88_06065, partial [Clostridiales bacterium]|nr:hypothetical protein [Clostridiales bacterium]
MKKRIISVLLMILVAFTACSLTACFFDKGDDEEGDDIYVTYHLNGGYTGGNPDNTEDYKDNIGTHNLYSYKPIPAKRDTWY